MGLRKLLGITTAVVLLVGAFGGPNDMAISSIPSETTAAGFNISGRIAGSGVTGVDYQKDCTGPWVPLNSPMLAFGAWASTGADVSFPFDGNHTVCVREEPNTTATAISNQFLATSSQTISVNTPDVQTSGVGFNVGGTYTAAAPTGIDIQVDGGAFTSLLSPTIRVGPDRTWASTAADVVVNATGGFHIVGMREQPNTAVTVTSGSFTVSP